MYTLGDIVRFNAMRLPDNEAVVFADVRLTFAQLNERVNRLANVLTDRGFKNGDRLAVLSLNSHKYLEIYFAAAKIGMSVTPLNIRLSELELEGIIIDCEASVLLVGNGYKVQASALREKVKRIKAWISLDETVEGFLDYEVLIAESKGTEPDVAVNENEMAVLMYTGGTTGQPKGVMMSHRGLMSAFLGQIIEMEFTTRDITCFLLPLFHVAFWSAMTVLLAGGKVIIMDKPIVHEIPELVSKEKCTHINTVPTVYIGLLDLPDIEKYDLSSLRIMNYGGGPMHTEVLKKCIKKFGNVFMQAYGSTEALGVSLLRTNDHSLEGEQSRLLSSVGTRNVCAEFQVVDENDNPLEPGETGEIVVRGQNLMMGYWKNPDLTARSIRNGWFHMGDMGYMDKNGYLFLVDRKSNMIVTGGENVYPKETEEILYQHPAILECAVVSAPSMKWGEQVQAVVVLKQNKPTVTEKKLIAHCRQSLAGYKCPKKIDFVDELPKTVMGKISLKDLKEKYWQGMDKQIG